MADLITVLNDARAATSALDDDIRVMVVDDAAVVRSLAARWIADAPGLRLVASARNGAEALERLDEAQPHVVVLDVEMPVMDGITTLPHLLQRRRDIAVIMASALTRDHAEVTLQALALGAADYIPKPSAESGIITSAAFRRELIDKIVVLGRRRKARPRTPRTAVTPALRRLGGSVQRAVKWRTASGEGAAAVQLRPFSDTPPRVLLIGASTGGPQALTRLIARLDAHTGPILITQHMPATFTTILAEHLSRAAARPVHEAIDGEAVRAGGIYLAPGGRHMRVARRNGSPVIVIDDSAPVHFCKPAVDPLFTSAAEVWGSWNLAVILTGMGTDGTAGGEAIVANGGSVIVQDEASSVVWGMPGHAAISGLCSAVLPLDQIATRVSRLFMGVRV